ncbi:MAG TPA: hypothetical protein VFU21_15200, partial [Kofleriaceae bacterium]|nr:hypothetical protein [Kofleriaceae bacterium]
MDTSRARAPGDESHEGDWALGSSRETAGALDRFHFATTQAKVRRRIPLSPDPVVEVEADLPPPPARTAE